MSQKQIKPKGRKLVIDYAQLKEALMPRMIDVLKESLPLKETYEKAINELNLANVSLQQKNKELLDQLDKYNKEIDATFQDHENRIQVLEGKPVVPAETPV